MRPGKISVNQWNADAAEAMRILEQAERGKLTDDEMRHGFGNFEKSRWASRDDLSIGFFID